MKPQAKPKIFPRRDRAVALLDQSLYAGTNFALTMLLVWLTELEVLGYFALIASISALLHSLYVGFILEPMTVYGSESSARSIRIVYSHVSALSCVSCLLLAALLYVASADVASDYIRIAALGCALFAGQGVVLCAKRIRVIERGVKASLLISLRYAVAALTVAATLAYFGIYNESSLVVTILVASLVAAGDWLAVSLTRRCSISEFVEVVALVKKYTSWTLVASIPATLSTHGIFWIAEIASDRTVIGQLKLCEQLLIPLGQVLKSMSLLDQIESAADYSASNQRSVLERLRTRTWSYIRLTSMYALAVIFFVIGFGAVVDSITDGFLSTFALYCVTALIAAYSVPRNVVAKACRKPEIVASAYILMAATIWLIGLIWRPDGVLQLVSVLIVGWIAHAITLQLRTVQMLSVPSSS